MPLRALGSEQQLTSFVIRRLLYAIPMLILVSFVSFVIINLPPGDYLTTMRQQLESQAGLTREEAMLIAERMAARYGLDRPFMVQYFEWIKGNCYPGGLWLFFSL